MKKLAIIGAGISGLSLASELETSYQVTVFDKSRGVSGRMSTRKANGFVFDHGAQYFTAKDDRFKAFIERHIEVGVVNLWQEPSRIISGKNPTAIQTIADTKPKYVAAPTMTSLCKALARSLNIKLSTEIIMLNRNDSMWYLTDSSNHIHGPFDKVVSSMPIAQFLCLANDYIDDVSLHNVQMSGCFSLMVGDSGMPLPILNSARITDSPIGWFAINSNKPERQGKPSIIVQSSNAWAQTNIEMPLDEVQKILIDEFSRLTGCDYTNAKHLSLHRWRYAFIEKAYGQAYYMHADKQLSACGDWCLGPRVESAYLSGVQLADALKQLA